MHMKSLGVASPEVLLLDFQLWEPTSVLIKPELHFLLLAAKEKHLN